VQPELETPPEVAAAPHSVPAIAVAPLRHWDRLVWVGEFLLALAVGAILWSEVGGQVHLDMMPWYLKLAPLFAFAWSVVRYTIAIVEHPGPWSFRSLRWLTAIILTAAAMFAITLYYHLHEPVDDNDDDEGVTMSLMLRPTISNWRSMA
jgi:hypothetical protein